MKIIQTPFKKPNLFIFTKQTNNEYIIAINPDYLARWRKTHLATPISEKDSELEKGVKAKLIEMEKLSYEIIWTALKAQLRKLSYKEKLELLKREWSSGYLSEHDIPSQVEKHFMTELTEKKIILPSE